MAAPPGCTGGEARRRDPEVTFSSRDEFPASLEMTAVVSAFTPLLTPRIAQLTQRSNQFNLCTVRYTERDIERFAASPERTTMRPWASAKHFEIRFTAGEIQRFRNVGEMCESIMAKLGKG
jgi:hypothetical protein